MKISAYVPCFNNRDTIAPALASIRAQTHPVDELFVVDDGSTDDTVKVVETQGVRVVRHDRNLGRGAARATAMQTARHELVLACDATIVLEADYVRRALPRFDDIRVAAVFGRVTQSTGANAAERWRGRHLFRDRLADVRSRASFATFGSLVRSGVVREVGGFNPSLRQGEDADLGERLLAADFDVICDPGLTATTTKTNTVAEVLERFTRWNNLTPMTWHSYVRQIAYAVKFMAREDLRAHDPLAALISLVSPHYQFIKSRRIKQQPSS